MGDKGGSKDKNKRQKKRKVKSARRNNERPKNQAKPFKSHVSDFELIPSNLFTSQVVANGYQE